MEVSGIEVQGKRSRGRSMRRWLGTVNADIKDNGLPRACMTERFGYECIHSSSPRKNEMKGKKKKIVCGFGTVKYIGAKEYARLHCCVS